ncbi:hypothetical protein DA075_10285 [Methylobacterium currus]|uniref:Uncharacterized protein n=1 Tax=Methylobacterium currus TaxID=2051553 RepID=A0A2R4WI85_9HYPH|nr:hypothetical protein [Methylobacterium currus]AWB21250.1 hypothetical protein DA075_10285 [Methylobacterium currus]
MPYAYALIVDARVHELFEMRPNLPDPLPKGWTLLDVAAYPDVAEGWLVDGSAVQAPPAPARTPAVVAEVSSAQAKIALSRAGHLSAVKDAVKQAGGEVEIWYTDARTWQRSNAYVAQIGTALGLDAAAIDDLFAAASQIQA